MNSATPEDRDPRTGRFLRGNKRGRGNPLARRTQKLRAAALRAVTPQDVAATLRALVEQARQGDVAAARLLLERTLGRREFDEPTLPPISGDPATLLQAAQDALAQAQSGAASTAAVGRALELLRAVADLWHLPEAERRLRALEDRR